MNTQYRKNLKAVATACKNYTDKVADDLRWQLGTYDLGVDTVNGTTMLLPTPANTIQATMVRVGGNSVECSNLVQNNTATTQYVDTNQFLAELLPSTTYTISFVSSASGSFTLRSVYSAIDLIYAQSVSVGLNSYTFTTPSNYTNTGNYLYFYATSDVVGTELRINGGSTALPYEPYYSGIHNLELSALKVEGANLSPVSTGRTNFLIDNQLQAGTYTISFGYSFDADSNWGVNLRKNDTFGETIATDWFISKTGNKTIQFTLNESCKVYVICHSQCDVTNIMLNRGSTALDYVPYIAPTTLPIDLTSIEDSGGNKLFADGKLREDDYITPYKATKGRGIIKLKDLDYAYDSSNQVFNSSAISNILIGTTQDLNDKTCLCSIYDYAGVGYASFGIDKAFIKAINNDIIRIKDSSYTDATLFKNHFSDNDILEFDLATPIEADIDLSQLVKFKAYSNGSITLVNTNNQDTTSTFKYLKEEVKA